MGNQTAQWLELQKVPKIPGLAFRNFRGPEDYSVMADVFAACRIVDELEWSYTVEDISNEIEHLTNFDPLQDILIAEVKGQPIAWTRAFWGIEYSGDRIYRHWGFVNPELRRMGLGTALLQFGEQQMSAVASDHPSDDPRLLQVWAADSQVGKADLLRRHH